MRMLLPDPHPDVDVLAAYDAVERPVRPGRPWLLANMVTTADGAVTVGGVSGALGGEADKEAFQAIRAVADVILVGAGTVRAEHYGPARSEPEVAARRTARGQAVAPRLAIVSGRLDLEPDARVFEPGGPDAHPLRPLVLTVPGADPRRRAALGEVAEVVDAGDAHVDPARALAVLGARGAGTVLTEGGPTLLGSLTEADLLDELCLTIDPSIAAGDGPRIVVGHEPAQRRGFTLAHLLEAEGVLLLRYQRTRSI